MTLVYSYFDIEREDMVFFLQWTSGESQKIRIPTVEMMAWRSGPLGLIGERLQAAVRDGTAAGERRFQEILPALRTELKLVGLRMWKRRLTSPPIPVIRSVPENIDPEEEFRKEFECSGDLLRAEFAKLEAEVKLTIKEYG